MAESNREEIAKLEALYANNPGGRVFTHLAEAYRKAGELDRARKILEDGIGRHADSASAHVVLGRVLQDQGAVVDAANAFQRVLELDPENRVALRSLGDLSRSAGQREEALGYYRQLQSLDPGDDDLAITIHRLQTEPRAEQAEAEAATAEAPQEIAAGPEAREPAAAGFAGDGGRVHEPAGTSGGEAHFVEAEAETEMTAEAELRAKVPEQPAAVESHSWAAPAPDEASQETTQFTETEGAEAPLEITAEAEPEPESAAVDPSAELDRAASFESMLSSGVVRAESPRQTGPDVPTETLAELYRTQGFYHRSAEVYRALLQRTPGDRVLEARLREVEQLDHEPAPPESAMTIEFEPLTEPDHLADSGTTPAEDEDAREEWMAGVASGWAEPEPAAPGDDGLYSWQDENFSDSSQGEPTLGDYFRQLLGWQPALPATASEPAPDEPEPLLIIDRDETAVSFEGQAEPAPMTVPLMEWEPPFFDEAPEAETPSAPAHAAQAPASSRSFSDNPVDAAFEEWFEGVPAGAPEPVEAAAPASAEYDGVPEPLAETGPAKSPEPSTSLNDESDDDLEMFRSWLQSLKR